jgi:hypothetical protein
MALSQKAVIFITTENGNSGSVHDTTITNALNMSYIKITVKLLSIVSEGTTKNKQRIQESYLYG